VIIIDVVVLIVLRRGFSALPRLYKFIESLEWKRAPFGVTQKPEYDIMEVKS
jgi:hypothetical protein